MAAEDASIAYLREAPREVKAMARTHRAFGVGADEILNDR
jgi:hypothetical protein